MLEAMEERLKRSGESVSGGRLGALQRFLSSSMRRIRTTHRGGAGGREVAGMRGALIDALLKHLFAVEGGMVEGRTPVALIANGGYGRGELNPHSDVDVLFLHNLPAGARRDALHAAVQRVLYLLWDLGLKVGHSTRTPAEAYATANEDLQTKTALMEARLVCGSASLFEQFQRDFVERCITGREEAYIDWRIEDQAARHAKEGASVFLQEPNIKQGCGGLRDVHNLLWVAYCWKRIRTTQGLVDEGVLARAERRQVERAYDFLMRVRNEAHFVCERPNDQLTLSLQGQVATGLGYSARTPVLRVEAFMRDYYRAAQDIFFLTNAVAARMAASRKGKRGLLTRLLPARTSKVEHEDGFIIRDGVIDIDTKASVFTADPSRLLRVFLMAQRRNLDLSFDLQRRIRRRLHMLDWKFIRVRRNQAVLMEILADKGKVARVLRLMHRTGVLGRMLPEFEPLTCLVQHEFFHRYTADEHTLVCLEQLDALVSVQRLEGRESRYQQLLRGVEDPALLYLAVLLHDSGKGRDTRNHSEESATLCQQAGRRLALPLDSIRLLTFLADHHLTMSQTAQRRNVDDTATIREFAAVVENQVRLDLLMLLTYADGRGTTGGRGWSDWKESLLWHLYEQTRLMLADGKEFQRLNEQRRVKQRQRVASLVASRVNPAEVHAHFALLPERYGGVVPDEIIAQHVDAVHDFMVRQVEGKESMLAPVLAWHHEHGRGNSQLIVVTWDREQLFAKIAGAVSLSGLNILSADIFTRQDHIVVDTLRVCTDRNEAVTDERDRASVARALEEALHVMEYDFEPLLEKVRRRRRPSHWIGDEFPTRLRFDNDALANETLLEITTPDRPALLHDLARTLARNEAQITFARIETEKGAAVDAFYLVDWLGAKITDPAALEALRLDLLRCVGAA
jgi:[protein-PII] uridylyltransferase